MFEGIHSLEAARKLMLDEEGSLGGRVTRLMNFVNEVGDFADIEKSKSAKNGKFRASQSESAMDHPRLAPEKGISHAERMDRDVKHNSRARALTAPNAGPIDGASGSLLNVAEMTSTTPAYEKEFQLWGQPHPLVRVPSDPRMEEDFDDEVIVFRPAFSRVISPSIQTITNLVDEEDRQRRYSFDHRVRSSSSLASLTSADADSANNRFPGLVSDASRRSFSEDFNLTRTIAPPPGFQGTVAAPPGFESVHHGLGLHFNIENDMAPPFRATQDSYPLGRLNVGPEDNEVFHRLW